ncbi:SRPBCC family protein [Phytohabitans kaempferiae]|uniref:SRPBCC family protein n=1 Tax=Phytohabitans kaempferiae TaxID=1620943 RepID=A0ABV6MGI1_9ACTN
MAKTASKVAGGGSASQLGDAVRDLLEAAAQRAVSSAAGRLGNATERMTKYAEGGGPGLAAAATGARRLAEGSSPVKAGLSAGLAAAKAKVKAALGRGKGAKNKVKVTNIVEAVDVGVPVRVAYNQWTRFEDFPKFMKKLGNVERTSEEKSTWKAQVFWSHRTWEATVVEQVPDRRIVWRSTGAKGSVDGTVTFHEVAPELTRVLLVLEYHPQGLFERTGNLWRAQGRRARLELKHFARHVMTQSILRPDEIEGWRGEIHDGQVVQADGDDGGAEDGESGPERGEARRPSRSGRDTHDRARRGRAGENRERPTKGRQR